jgi:hypothetical protein
LSKLDLIEISKARYLDRYNGKSPENYLIKLEFCVPLKKKTNGLLALYVTIQNKNKGNIESNKKYYTCLKEEL